MNNNKYSLLHKASDEHNVYQSINTKKAGWNLLNFNSRILKKGQEWENNTGNYEYGIILMSGSKGAQSYGPIFTGSKSSSNPQGSVDPPSQSYSGSIKG